MNQLYYLTATEKDRLQTWLANRPDVGGVLMLEDQGIPVFKQIGAEKQVAIAAGPREKKVFELNGARFSAAAYETASDWLTEVPENPAVKWLIVDGIGQLELRKEGLHLLLQNMALRTLPGINVVLVIAPEVLEKVLKRYQLQERALLFEI